MDAFQKLRISISSVSLPFTSSSLGTREAPGPNMPNSEPRRPDPLLLKLPSEVLSQILGYLPPLSLVDLSATCRHLRSHAHDDLLWARLIREELPFAPASPLPCASWRELYKTHHPYWFLPKHKIWFSDREASGQLIIARYDPRTGSIEGYRLLAQNNPDQQHPLRWEWKPSVFIHFFRPEVYLFLDDPVVKLDRDAYEPGPRLTQEVTMYRRPEGIGNSICSKIGLARSMAPEIQSPSMMLWPPQIFPTTDRVRSDSHSGFRSTGHRPEKHSQISDNAFRIRKWMQFGGGGLGSLSVRMTGEAVSTFGTLPAECYTPDTQKPWQGIWVGDYSAHGCEFLVVIQKTPEEAKSAPKIRLRRSPSDLLDMEMGGYFSTENLTTATLDYDNDSGSERSMHEVAEISMDERCEDVYKDASPPGDSGRLECMKLTGDPHVRRGEYTWIAEDIGQAGLIRVAQEEMFRGARVVKSWGHIAARGFLDRESLHELCSWSECEADAYSRSLHPIAVDYDIP